MKIWTVCRLNDCKIEGWNIKDLKTKDLKITNLKNKDLNDDNQSFPEKEESCNWIYLPSSPSVPHDKKIFAHLLIVVDDVKLTDTAKVEVKQLKGNVLPTTKRQVISSGHYYHKA